MSCSGQRPFAAHKHEDQRRKDAGPSPYINHPLTLATVLHEEGDVDDVEVIAAALLHDTVEDTDTSYAELRGLFGDDIVAGPRSDWSPECKREYFDWAKQVVDQVRGTNAEVERRFDQLYRRRP